MEQQPVATVAVTIAAAPAAPPTAVAACTSMSHPSRYLLRYHIFLIYLKTHCLHTASVRCPAVFLHRAAPACSE
uniref:Putative secreted peptide n=1 Tax=Anopheles braziliensis TaxID=58242 RepID=A0A2M3ZSU5_9DIPT